MRIKIIVYSESFTNAQVVQTKCKQKKFKIYSQSVHICNMNKYFNIPMNKMLKFFEITREMNEKIVL